MTEAREALREFAQRVDKARRDHLEAMSLALIRQMAPGDRVEGWRLCERIEHETGRASWWFEQIQGNGSSPTPSDADR